MLFNSTLPLSNTTIISNSTLVNSSLSNSTLSSALATPSANASSNATLATLSAFWSSAYPMATANASLNISSSSGYLASGSAVQTGVAKPTEAEPVEDTGNDLSRAGSADVNQRQECTHKSSD